jgi:hypothetical protein
MLLSFIGGERMGNFVEFYKCKACDPPGLCVNLNFFSRCQITRPNVVTLEFSSFAVEVIFNPKTPRAEEFACQLMSGNTNITPFFDDITKIKYCPRLP